MPFSIWKQSISRPLKYVRKLFGCRNSFRSWVWSKRSIVFTLTIKVSFICVKILYFTLDPNTLIWGIIGFEMCWIPNYWYLRRFTLMIMVLPCWLRHYLRKNSCFTNKKRVWWSLPNELEGKIVGLVVRPIWWVKP